MNAADAGVASRDVAICFGLHFVKLAEERYDLIVPTSLTDDPRVERFFDVLSSRGMRSELETLGYDLSHSLTRVDLVGGSVTWGVS
jgi:molybdate-binding protein